MTDRVFYVVPVVLTEAEYNRLRDRVAPLTPSGRVDSELLRTRMDMYPRAYGEGQLSEELQKELHKVYRVAGQPVDLPCDNDPGE